ncbi:MAG TPA: GNAT family N-acetyltransferase [Gaiellales bacterium]|nr:GNAT family N-acetyltransferase [Gaiellales bacterium]
MERQRYAVRPGTVLRRLAEHDAGGAGEMLARAFAEDPLCVHLFRDPATRALGLAAALTWNLRYGLRYGDVLAAAAGLAGVAVLLRPSEAHFSPERLEATGYQQIEEALGPGQWARFDAEFGRIFGDADAALHRATGGHHWYLDLIGVDPLSQGTGLGGALLGAINAQADAVGADIALLTFQPSVLTFYRRFGYRIVCEGVDRASGVWHWGCVREPRAGAAGFELRSPRPYAGVRTRCLAAPDPPRGS